jgi:hypothetical protein
MHSSGQAKIAPLIRIASICFMFSKSIADLPKHTNIAGSQDTVPLPAILDA